MEWKKNFAVVVFTKANRDNDVERAYKTLSIYWTRTREQAKLKASELLQEYPGHQVQFGELTDRIFFQSTPVVHETRGE